VQWQTIFASSFETWAVGAAKARGVGAGGQIENFFERDGGRLCQWPGCTFVAPAIFKVHHVQPHVAGRLRTTDPKLWWRSARRTTSRAFTAGQGAQLVMRWPGDGMLAWDIRAPIKDFFLRAFWQPMVEECVLGRRASAISVFALSRSSQPANAGRKPGHLRAS